MAPRDVPDASLMLATSRARKPSKKTRDMAAAPASPNTRRASTKSPSKGKKRAASPTPDSPAKRMIASSMTSDRDIDIIVIGSRTANPKSSISIHDSDSEDAGEASKQYFNFNHCYFNHC